MSCSSSVRVFVVILDYAQAGMIRRAKSYASAGHAQVNGATGLLGGRDLAHFGHAILFTELDHHFGAFLGVLNSFRAFDDL